MNFTLLVTPALLVLGVALGEVGCAVLAPWTPEQDAPAGLHVFGPNLLSFGCQAGRTDAPLCCKRLAQGDLVLGWGLEGGNVIYSNGSG